MLSAPVPTIPTPDPSNVAAAMYANSKLFQILRHSGRACSVQGLIEAWPLLTPAQAQVMAVRYTGAWLDGGRASIPQVATRLQVSRGTVYNLHERAGDVLYDYFRCPHAWVGLAARVRSRLLAAELRHPEQLAAQVVFALCDGKYGPWGPESSRALNRQLGNLGVSLLHHRVHPSYLEENWYRRRLGLNPAA